MGSADPHSPPNERPRHVVTVRSFWIDRTEVTVQAYRGCVEAHSCAAPIRSSASCTYDAGDPRLPISCVHWNDAEAFCRAMGKRLPRESEWELAGRGAKGRKYPWAGSATGCFLAATAVGELGARTCTKRPSPVGSHPMGATPSGIQDLAGNVEEWTADWYVENLAYADVPAAGASHVLRGGGWLSPPSAGRMTSRNWGSSVEAGPNVGFRCARDD
jgi:formylglycine-generating enzyme required for sulfatase activity